MIRYFAAAMVVAFIGSNFSLPQVKEQTKGDAGTEKFDPSRNPEKDLLAAEARAAKSNQRILLDVGGEWCSWCHKLDKFFETNHDVADFLHKNFVVVKINYSKENKNEEFLSRFPQIKGYPHLFVLDQKGKLLHSQDTGLLESGDHHDHDKVFEFLKKWAVGKGT